MDPAVVAAAFLAVFPAELPDKTMFASLVLSARYGRPALVWLGATAAFAVQVAIAVAAGRLLALLPGRVVALGAAVLFAVGAVVLARGGGDDDDGDVDDELEELDEIDAEARASGARTGASGPRVVGTAFGVVFLAEWGDLTQLATAGLAAASDAPLSVYVGALAALAAVAGIAAVAGRALLAVVPPHVVRRIAAAVFALLAVAALVEAVRG